MSGPTFPPGDGRAKTVLLFVGGLLATIAAVAAIVLLWPEDDEAEVVSDVTTTTRPETTDSPDSTTGEPSQQTTTTRSGSAGQPAQLFERGAQGALDDMATAAGRPRQAMQIAVYPTYAFLAYRSPDDPSHIDRRSWREGADQDDAAPNPIADRVDADSEPKLFTLAAVDLATLPRLVDDAAGRFGGEVEVTHVLIDRFLPFDQRVLIRVYATPTDGRSGGGYVQYTLDGKYVKTVA